MFAAQYEKGNGRNGDPTILWLVQCVTAVINSLWRRHRLLLNYACSVWPCRSHYYRQRIRNGSFVTLLFTTFLACLLLVSSFVFVYKYSSAYLKDASNTDKQETKARQINSSIRVSGQKEYINKHGVHVIVGQYMGKGFPWINEPNLTNEIVNSNNYSPVSKFGENGSPVYIPEFERSRAQQLFFVNRFNLIASDMISVNRSLPDVRKNSCRKKRYDVNLLHNTSIIIVFHNEAWSTLVRTVHSVINRSSRRLLREIILIDDASERIFLGQQLNDYMKKLTSHSTVHIRIIRSAIRVGLINARIIGAKAAKGKTLTFLDAHCETTNGWLEPLLYRISIDPKVVVCPVIDIINDQTFAYSRSFDSHWGAINWGMSFRWFTVGQKELRKISSKNYDDTIPFRTPIMAGGLFSIDRQFFFDMGSYDPNLKIWGGENIEMSLRIWQCGGRIEISPCSHVGHVFRSSSPYSFGQKQVGDVLYANLIRVAEVWMDEWKDFFYKMNPTAALIRKEKPEVLENITERINLKNKLKCNSFEWYLNNVWPEHFFPTKLTLFGQIQNLNSLDCIERPSNGKHPTGKVIMAKCAIELYAPQSFVFNHKSGFIKTDESVCLDVNSSSEYSAVLLIACSEFDRQRWKYQSKTNQIVHIKTKLCLTLNKRGAFLSIKKCKDSNIKQKWTFISQQWNY